MSNRMNGKMIPLLAALTIVCMKLVRGADFSVSLSETHVANLIVVRVHVDNYNRTKWGDDGCSRSVSDFFPASHIAFLENERGYDDDDDDVSHNSALQLSMIDDSSTSPVLVTIYNPETDQVCDTQRRMLALPERIPVSEQSTTPSQRIRITSLCWECHGDEASRKQLMNDDYPLRTWENEGKQSYTSMIGRGHLAWGEKGKRIRKQDVYVQSIQLSHDMKSVSDNEFLGFSLRIQPDRMELLESPEVLLDTQPSRQLKSVYGIGSGSDSDVEPSNRSSSTLEDKGNIRSTSTTVVRLPVNQKTAPVISISGIGVRTLPFPGVDKVANTSSTFPGASPNMRVTDHDRQTTSCSIVFDECCEDRDCISASANEVCVERTCIDQGNPRFTLSWVGDDDLDLYVVTPNGFVLSFADDLDKESGGRVGESIEQTSYGHHVENVYFPLSGGPDGTYDFYVRPLTTVESADTWTLSVHDESGQIIQHSGSRFSPVYQYTRGDGGSSPVLPPPTSVPVPSPTPMPEAAPVINVEPTLPPFASPACDGAVDECCENSDCPFQEEVCENRNCIDDGNPRITLAWVGDDDLDLFVETPAGIELSFMNFFDAISGGRFGEEVEQFGDGHHVENVYFPMEGAPSGNYQFFVRALSTVGSDDTWTLSVVEEGQLVMRETGSGASNRFYYHREREEPTPSVPTAPTARPVSAPVSRPTQQPIFQFPTPPSRPPQTIPGGPPTRPPQNDDDCNPFFDECCSVSDCRTSRDICEQRQCIRDGNPRVTLIWDGDDDLDVFVITPNGLEISAGNPFDMFSGGRLDMDPSQDQLGKHVESVHFPILGTPVGTFTYGVRSMTTVSSADDWVLEVYEGGELVNSNAGRGSSAQYEYERDETFEGPQRPRPSPPRCSPLTDECCLDSDCSGGNDVCVQRTCLGDGSPRITLRWIGDDDLNLVVETPGGPMLSNSNQFDSISGGRHQGDPQQSEFGFHVESVYFDQAIAPAGGYKFSIQSAATRGVSADVWRVTVYEQSQEVQEQTGIGESRVFDYERLNGVQVPRPSPPNPTSPPFATGSCSNLNNECCRDTDCGSDELCANRNCINEGNPRVTLTWVGDDDFDLSVRTPAGDTIFYNNRKDDNTGGLFGGEAIQTAFGFHTESVYFPSTGSPLGEYKAIVRLASRRGNPDIWTLRFFDGGMQQISKTGTGDSEFFSFDRTSVASPGSPTPPVPSPSPLSPISEIPRPGQGPFPTRDCPHECCSDSDCSLPDDICVQRTCIAEGTPRFTLTWTGNDDLSLAVVTPGGVTVSNVNPTDAISGGTFAEDSNQPDFGFHVENIIFPTRGGPEGDYLYFVKGEAIRGSADRWALRIFVDEELVAWRTGTGESRTFTYSLGSDVSFPSLPPVGQPNPPVDIPTVATRPPVIPPSNTFCDSAVNECCSDSECVDNEVCTQRTCINEGNPRFTVTWTGDDDLDLVVMTPLDTVVSFLNDIDPESGGRFGESGDQFEFGQHVENIFFPPVRSPTGIYKYYIRSFLPKNQYDAWTVRVFVNGQEVDSTTGSGNSVMLTYDYLGAPPTSPPVSNPTPGVTLPPQSFPTTAPSCDFDEEECCMDSQCITGVETCVQFHCIDLGNPRFTLIWTGDDDLDLKVKTPFGNTISFVDPFDQNSGGIYGEEGSQFVFDEHVENVFFPAETTPLGIYTYSVESFFQRSGNDRWTVVVYVDNQEVATETGFGGSIDFSYDFQGSENGPSPPPVPCSLLVDECCQDSDCQVSKELCVQRTCIDRGNPRFTLTWTGDDDYDLTVVSPFGTTIAVETPEDSLSGGVFGEEGDQLAFGQHVENIYFPLTGGPSGTYTYLVSNHDIIGTPDEWTLTVWVNDVPVATQTWSGPSDVLLYDFLEGFTLPPSPPQTPPPAAPTAPTPAPIGTPPTTIACDITENECCADQDCPAADSLCVQRICIDEGNPRFTLTWNGDDDYDLTVAPPIGGVLSFTNQVDDDSGGRFGEDGVQAFAGLHAENIFFPLEGGPIGSYRYNIQPFQIVNGEDTWTVRVYVGGQIVDSVTGTGDSGPLTYQYTSGSIMQPRSVSTCSPETDDCCEDSDCPSAGDLCIQRSCLTNGNPLVVLTWTGDDDLDLTVVTPQGTELSYYQPNDNVSNGRFVQSLSDTTFGYSPHMESVIFLVSDTPVGQYHYKVTPFNTVGSRDHWTVQIFVDGIQVAKQIGQGDSELFSYEYESALHALLSPGNDGATGTDEGEDNSDVDCLVDSDCPTANAMCIHQACLTKGALQWTLYWKGTGDVDLTVWVPGLKFYKASEPQPDAVGVTFEHLEHPDQGKQMRHLVFTADAAPSGKYTYSIAGNLAFEGQWHLLIHQDGHEVLSKRGDKVESSFFFFDYNP